MIQLRLDNTMKLQSAVYAQHNTAERCAAAEVPRTPSGRPIVYVAEGSYASYYWAGDHRIVVETWPDQWDYADGLGGTVAPSLVDPAVPTPWLD